MAGLFWIGRNVLLSTLDLKLRYPRGVRAQRVIDPVVDSPYALLENSVFLESGIVTIPSVNYLPSRYRMISKFVRRVTI